MTSIGLQRFGSFFTAFRGCLFAGLIICSVSSAGLLEVPAEYATIRTAVQAATDGDEIVVSPGTYVGPVALSGKHIRLRSLDPENPQVVAGTVVDARQADSALIFSGSESAACVIAGLTLTGGRATYGGGVAGHHTHAQLSHCRIVGNTAEGVVGNEWFPFTGGDGGGVAHFDGTIEDCEIARNVAVSGFLGHGVGAGLYLCNAQVRRCTIEDNISTAAPFPTTCGGLAYCNGTLEFNLIRDNAGDWALVQCNGRIANNVVTGHSGPALLHCNGTVVGNLIYSNGAGADDVRNFWNNTVYGNVSGVTITLGSVRNNILWNNGPINLVYDPARVPVEYNCIQNWSAGGLGNTAADPRLQLPEQGAFQPLADSSCIDAGVAVAQATPDLEGHARPLDSGRGPLADGSQMDIGAYESTLVFGPAPNRPVNLSPIEATYSGPSTPTLLCDAFSSADPGATHAASRWQVALDPDFSNLRYDSDWRADSRLQHAPPPYFFSAFTRYYWRVSQRDQHFLASAWSQPTRFYTGDTGPVYEGLHVPGDFPTIQAAIDAAPAGVQVVVAPGVYRENIYFKGKSIVVRSTAPENPDVVAQTTIDGGAAGSVVRFAGVETESAGLLGLTLRNGKNFQGGGVWGEGTHATLRYNRIINCTGEGFAAHPLLGIVPTGNAGGVWNCDGLVESNLIAENYANGASNWRYDNGYGGGLWACDGTIRYNSFVANRTGNTGAAMAQCSGAIYGNIVRDHVGPALFQCNGEIRGNTLEANLSAVLVECGGRVSRNLIRDNHGTALVDCLGAVENNLIVSNRAAASGVGAFRHNTVSGNAAGITAATCLLANNILWNNGERSLSIAEADQSYAVIEYNCIQGWGADGLANLGLDPQFVDASAGDFQLAPQSPYVDGGIGIAEVTEDYDGRPRPVDSGRGPLADGSHYDLGAYEAAWTQAPGPATPVALSPVGITLPSGEAPVLVASAFASDRPAATHWASRWQVARDAEFQEPVYDSFWDRAALTAKAAPPQLFSPDSTYYWRVSYRDQQHAASAWSLPAEFRVTQPPPPIIAVPLHYPTLQAAINASVDGAVVVASTGTYRENLYMRDHNVVLRSLAPEDAGVRGETIIDGCGRGRVITFAGGEDERCAVRGFTLRGGVDPNGAAVLGRSCRAALQYCLITDNTGVVVAGLQGVIAHNRLLTNHGSTAQAVLQACHGTIRENALWDYPGYGVLECNGQVLRNDVARMATGIYGANGTVDGNRVHGCTTGIGNVAVFRNGLLAENQLGVEYPSVMQNCTIAGNLVGARLYRTSQFDNCIVWGNKLADFSKVNTASHGEFRYCCARVDGGTGVINADPQMIYPAGGVYRLRPTSPCIDAGMRIAGAGSDVDGVARPWIALPGAGRGDGSGVDIGAFEFDEVVDGTSPLEPTNISPRDAVETDPSPLLTATRFESPRPEYVHLDSEWQVDVDPAFPGAAYDSDWDRVHKTSLEVPVGVLFPGTLYYWRVRYRNQARAVSAWSAPTSFRTRGLAPLGVPRDYPTIQAAIDAAENGAVIIVATGAYFENLNMRGKALTLRSADPLDASVVAETIIDGRRLAPVVTFEGGEPSVTLLAGFTITHGSALFGGGILGHYAQATVERNRIVDNLADGNHSDAVNGTGHGGGVARLLGAIRYNLISGNRALGTYDPVRQRRNGGHGGGLFECGAPIESNQISDNVANGRGGGVYACSSLVRFNTITRNTANLGGGISDCGGSILSNRILENVVERINGQIGAGGGINSCQGLVAGNLIACNTGAVGAGAQGVRTFYFNTVVANVGEPSRSAVSLLADGQLMNCIIWGNQPRSMSALQKMAAGRDKGVRFNLIENWAGGGEANLAHVDPLLWDPEGGDFRLQAGSPCIDAGTPRPEMDVDLDGVTRPQGAAPDLGAFEYVDHPEQRPARPVNVLPPDGDPNTPLEPTLAASDFASPVMLARHAASRWQISLTPDFANVVLDTGWQSVSLTSLPVPARAFSFHTTYYWRVSYRDELKFASLFSQATGFYTGRESAVIHVPDDYPTLQEAIDAATSGFEIIARPGVYRENINFKHKNVTLRSTDPTDAGVVAGTVIDGGRAGTVVRFGGTEDESCILSGFTITNGVARQGGGIAGAYVQVGTGYRVARPTLEYNVIRDNTAERVYAASDSETFQQAYGGGVYGCHGPIRHNTIAHNYAHDYGGGLYGCDGRIEDNRIEDNGSIRGGGVASCDGDVVGNQIRGNRAIPSLTSLDGWASGGGLYGCRGRIERNQIEYNLSSKEGGGVSYCQAVIRFNHVHGNHVETTGAWSPYGGGFYDCDAEVVGNLVDGNWCGPGGRGAAFSHCDGWIAGNTVVDNTSQSTGSAAFKCKGTISSCVFRGNGSGDPYAESSGPTYCIVEVPRGNDLGAGSIVGDPRFVDAAAGNFRLRPGSPAINAGIALADVSEDLDRQPRPREGAWDMGAYEFDPDAWGGRPVPPVHASPADGATAVALPVQLDVTPFVPPAPGVAHQATHWQIAKQPDFSRLYCDGGQDALHLTSLTPPDGALAFDSTYYWRAAFVGDNGLESFWSQPTSFTVAPGGTLHVPGDYAGIQAAIDAAAPGMEIVVAPGVYYENLNLRGKTLLLRSTDPSDASVVASTIIDGSRQGPVVAFAGNEDEDGLLAGFTLRHGLAPVGAAVYGHGCRTTLRQNVIEDNLFPLPDKGSAYPGDVYRCNGLVEGNLLRGNGQVHPQAQDPGALKECHGTIRGNTIEANAEIGVVYCNGLVERNVIRGNSGGGLWGCMGVVQYNQITGNRSTGGLSWCEGTVQYNLIADNSGTSAGGLYHCTGEIRYNRILRNTGTGDGGGICYADTGSVVGNLIAGNRAGNRGGGLEYCNGPIYNNTIVNNDAANYGGAAHYSHGQFLNNVIWGNTQFQDPRQLFSCSVPSYCLAPAGESGSGAGNVSGDPLFVDAAHGDYRLLDGSPGIDAGTAIASVTEDLDAVQRPLGDGWDIGAYEFDASRQPTPTPTPTPMPAVVHDLNGDGVVDGDDLLMLLERYHTNQKPMDFDNSGRIDCRDLMMFSEHWRAPAR